jgi:flagellar biosynthesis protein FlhA
VEQEQVINRDLVLANSNILSAVAVLVVLGLMIVPVPPILLDLMLTFSIAFSVTVLLVALYLKEPLQFNSFPSLLLILTLMRLSLNVASTRLILSTGQAGQVIDAFGHFVVGGNYVIGVHRVRHPRDHQLHGHHQGLRPHRRGRRALHPRRHARQADGHRRRTERRHDHGGRCMRRAEDRPGGGLLRRHGRRQQVRQGRCHRRIIITIINIVGGFAIGVMQKGMSASEALSRFTMLTVGDGLVSQVPALLVSTAAGLVVTRTSGNLNLGQTITVQIFRQTKALYLSSGALAVLALVPGLPTVPFLIFAAGTALTGNFMSRRVKDFDKATEEQIENEDQVQQQAKAVEERPGLRGEDLFVLDKLELEIGYGLIPLVDEARGGDLLHRIGSIRRQVGSELGIFIHPVRVRDNLQLAAQEYVIKLKGVEVARAQLIPGRLLAMSTRPDCGPLEGMATTEPAFNLPAVWIDADSKSRAEMEGYTVVEPAAVLATHLSELIRAHADEMLSRQDVKDMCESMREFAPSLVEDLIPDRVPINTLHNVLRALLHERVPVRDLTTILETLANQGATAHGPDFLVARVREALARSITALYTEGNGKLHVVALHPECEQVLVAAARDSESSGGVAIAPGFTREFLSRLETVLRAAYAGGTPPVLLVPTPIRLFVKRLIEPTYPNLAVMGYTEVTSSASIVSAGTVVTNGSRLEQQAVA